jgi:hypothetical protein
MTDKVFSRRLVFKAAAGLALATGAARAARADIILSKDSVGYQDVPNDGKVCAQCVYFEFMPASGTTPQSRCKLVAGNINPAGWCEVWAQKTT